jgi:hypothetical protein
MAWMFDVSVCVYSVVCVVLYLASGLATGWSLVQGVLPIVCRSKEKMKTSTSWEYHLRGMDKKLRTTTRNLSQDSRCYGRDSNRTPLEYKSTALSLDWCVRFQGVESFLRSHVRPSDHYSLPLVPILSHMAPVHSPIPCFGSPTQAQLSQVGPCCQVFGTGPFFSPMHATCSLISFFL